MIIFAIPLRKKETSSNWKECINKLEGTIDSIYNQTCGNFKILLACNSIPAALKEYDNKLEYLVVDIPKPDSWVEMARDKFWKLTVIGARIRELLLEFNNSNEGVFVMPIDADDLINKRVVEYVEQNDNAYGFVSDFGYIRYGNSKYMHKIKDLHRICGSCNIIRMHLEELPKEVPSNRLCHDEETARILNAMYPIRFDHHIVVDKYKEEGREFSRLPFPSTIYQRDTGDNISNVFENENKVIIKKKFHPIALVRKLNLTKYKWISKKIQNDFSLNI